MEDDESFYECNVCGELATIACEECYNSFYCGAECKGMHICDHVSEEYISSDDSNFFMCDMCDNVAMYMCADANYCSETCQTKDVGREYLDICMVCDEDVPYGQDYCSERCKDFEASRFINTSIGEEEKDNRCDVCGKLATMVCSRCYGAQYCGEECQKADWNLHWTEDCVHVDDMDDEEVLEAIGMDIPIDEARIMLIEAGQGKRRGRGISQRRARSKIRRTNRRRKRQKRKALRKVRRSRIKEKRRSKSRERAVERRGRSRSREVKRMRKKAQRQERRQEYKDKAPERKAKRKEKFQKFKKGLGKKWDAYQKRKAERRANQGKGGTGTGGGSGSGGGGLSGGARTAAFTAGGAAAAGPLGAVGGYGLAKATEK